MREVIRGLLLALQVFCLLAIGFCTGLIVEQAAKGCP